MPTSPVSSSVTADEILAATIRDLVESDPQTLELLAPLGLDLCCGGGHQLGEALRLHDIDTNAVVPALLALFGRRASAD